MTRAGAAGGFLVAVVLVLGVFLLDLGDEDECDAGEAPDCTVCVEGCA